MSADVTDDQEESLEARVRRRVRPWLHWLWRVTVAWVLLKGIGRPSPEHFVLLKFTVSLSFFFWAWACHDRGQVTWRNVLLTVALAFNPFFPVPHPPAWFRWIAAVSAVIAMASAWALPSMHRPGGDGAGENGAEKDW